MDRASITAGADFFQKIQQAVDSCHVLLVLMGQHWLTIADVQGQRRLDDPDDFVRLEIETGLARNLRVIPVLLDNATMPRPEHLPGSLKALARLNALELTSERYEDDIEHLLEEIERGDIEQLLRRANTLVADDRHREALRFLDRALELDPDYLPALRRRGGIHVRMLHYPEATIDLNRVLVLAPNDSFALEQFELLIRPFRRKS